MPDSVALNRLRRKLQEALAPNAVLRSVPWVDPRPMRDAVKAVEQTFEGIGNAPPAQGLLPAVRTFLREGTARNFNQLKYVCYGVTLALDSRQERLIDRNKDFALLIDAVDGQRGEDRRYRRCYQALLQSYFAFESRAGEEAQTKAADGFLTLRAYLSDRLQVVARPASGRVAGWVLTLKEHDNLLTDKPCDRYTGQLAQGRTDMLAEVCAGLGISRNSWVWQEVILAYLREICGRDDQRFKQVLDTALDLAEGRTELKPSQGTSRLVVSNVVKRYSQAVEHPELPRLRDACVERIGNPWLKRTDWEAWVRHEPARQMVDGWLKSKLMEDFFTLLSDHGGGAVDRRRLDYWLRYVDVIEDMWFVLGSSANQRREPEFVEMRKRMSGRRLALQGTDSFNNAFIMQIDGWVLIEFGKKGNALYYYQASGLPFELDGTAVSIHALKRGLNRLRHGTDWEAEFSDVFKSLLGSVPTSAAKAIATGRWRSAADPPTSAPTRAPHASLQQRVGVSSGSDSQPPATKVASVLRMCDMFGVKHEDLRTKGGSLWVYADPGSFPALVSTLMSLGFKHTPKRGYWLDNSE